MLTENTTPFAALGFEQWHRDGGTMAVIAVRGRFEVGDDGTVELADEQGLVLADGFAGDPHATSMVAAGDLVPWRPACDLTHVGPLHAAEPRMPIQAGLQIGDHAAVVRAHGPRQWTHEGGRWRLTPPGEVPETVDVSYRHAVGGRFIGDPDGRVDVRNPIGPGRIDPEFTPTSRAFDAPRIDREDDPLTDEEGADPRPRGLGPIPPWWRARQRHAGTYDDAWREARHPRLPADFDYRFHQVAHPDLILPVLPRGDETVYTVGLVPGGGRLDVRLPALTPWARFAFADGREVEAMLTLDGIHLDFREGRRLDLTWRCWIETCPAFHRIDLHHGPTDKVRAARLPVAGGEGLHVA